MNNKILPIVGVALVIVIGLFVYMQKQDKLMPTTAPTTSNTPAATSTSSAPATTPAASGPTMATVATHNSRTSCWSAINGFAYDLTGWIPNHPGGEQAILSLCGKDGTAAFTSQHGTSKKILTVLAGFKIGVLVK